MKHLSENNIKAIASLFVLLVAFGIFLIFIAYQNSIIESGMYQSFITLAIIGAGFLVGILYLIHNSHFGKPVGHVHKGSTSRSKPRKKKK